MAAFQYFKEQTTAMRKDDKILNIVASHGGFIRETCM